MKKKSDITIVHKPDAPIATEILAKHIAEVSRGMKRIMNGPLGHNALVLLLQDACGGRGAIAQADINLVLKNLPRLEELYIRAPKKKR